MGCKGVCYSSKAPPADCFLHSQTGPSISRRVAQHVLMRTAPRAFPPESTSIMNIASIREDEAFTV
ncbi:hypothetical protein T11_4637 [Trichinella zimbabwensis]|uniref:Uncharacterized protein n=1 Tax=Trichinella zimbabwensis TaxID=268475 RepID=A0A0V1HVF6_9BILA|nr:hypothetical protein T11_4637 [Trichinella zimbabwensis]